MALSIYKPGQGKYTRLLTAAGAGVLTLAGAMWLWDQFQGTFGDNTIFVQAGAAVGLIAVMAGLLFWSLNKPRIADFMIATEVEMKKVNWPSRREIIGSTWVVICGTFLFAIILFVIDLGFGYLFQKINILKVVAETAT
jgi:preprotein translocase subunit SecE